MAPFLAFVLVVGLGILIAAAMAWLCGGLIISTLIRTNPNSMVLRRRSRKFHDITEVTMQIGVAVVGAAMLGVVIHSAWLAV